MTSFKQKALTLTLALAQLAVVGWLDYITSYEISLAIFYYLPIAYAAWHLGRLWSFVFSILCATTLTWVEVASGQHYSSDWVVAERVVMQVLVFGFVAFSFNYFKRAIAQEKEKVRRLEGMLTFCSCCHKLRDEQGNWTDLNSFLREGRGVETEAKLCPTCAREMYATGGVRKVD
jgi:hypothetical protein